MRELRTEVEIDAPIKRVWEVLSAVDQWGEWNPLIPIFAGDLRPGGRIRFQISLAHRRMPIAARMLRFEPPGEICWRGPPSFLLGTLFSGEHWMILRPTADGKTRFLHGERFDGVVLPLLWRRLEPELQRGYMAMNQALKDAVESR